ERTGAESLRRYGAWSRAGLPGGAAFAGAAAALLSIARAPAPGVARAVVAAMLVIALLTRMAAPALSPGRPTRFAAAVGVVPFAVAVWLALFPGAWADGWAGRGARALSATVPAGVASFGRAVAAIALVASVAAMVAS